MIPALVRPLVGARVATGLASLLAIAPLHVAAAIAGCRRAFGEPVFDDGAIVVFAVRPG